MVKLNFHRDIYEFKDHNSGQEMMVSRNRKISSKDSNNKFTTINNTSVDRNMKFSFSDYGHYLASAILQFGYETETGLFIYGHYNYSLTTMNNWDYGPGIGNRAAGVTIGKYLKSK